MTRSAWKAPPRLLGLAALAAALFSAQPASAQTTLTAGNVPQAGDENILLNTGTTGFSVLGTSNQTGFQVNFSSTEEITAPASGQARVEATDGVVNNLGFEVVGGTFTSAIFNPFIGGANAPPDGVLKITVLSTTNGNANAAQVFNNVVIGNGSNFQTLAVSAQNGTVINKVLLESTTGFVDLRQVRIGQSTSTDGSLVPEPVSLALVLPGLLPLGLLVLRRRRAEEA